MIIHLNITLKLNLRLMNTGMVNKDLSQGCHPECKLEYTPVRATTPSKHEMHSLPPASEGWGRYCFHRCVSVHTGGGGVPQAQVFSQVTGPRSFPRRGYPYPRAAPPGPGQNNRACTCYSAGGIPLAFTQEDCLVCSVLFFCSICWLGEVPF